MLLLLGLRIASLLLRTIVILVSVRARMHMPMPTRTHTFRSRLKRTRDPSGHGSAGADEQHRAALARLGKRNLSISEFQADVAERFSRIQSARAKPQEHLRKVIPVNPG